MPEIKNTFNQGKMNKDLDERLIPKGQYRDALNISVATSEGSDVGTVQNIMGNSMVDSLSSGGTCVGSISNELTNRLYMFVKMLDKDVIVEYDKSDAPYSASSFIAVDLGGENAFLKFTGKQVTGINIIDDFLFWTDGDSEPKKINIEETRHKDYPTDITIHSRLYIDGEDKGFLTEDYVTVIKKKPSIAPTYKMNSSIGAVGSAIFEKIFPRFCFRYKYRDGEYSAMGPFTDVVFNAEYDDEITSLNSYSVEEPYNKTMTNVIKSIDLYDFVPSDIPKDVVQVDLLYKQENSNVVYSIDNIKYTDSEWGEVGSGQLATNPVSGVDLGFGEMSSHKGKYNISTESIHAALPENQLLRPWDNVPKRALAQEVVGNRIVYGNYTQGYDLGKDSDGSFLKPNVNPKVELRENQNFSEGGLRSLKSKRDYQVGVVLGDKYGRETPVFTSKKGVKIDWRNPELGLNASNSNMFKAYVDLEAADWVDYYKFYIKETSGEYYNLIMDRVYLPPKHVDFHNDTDHVWLSFASSDRNKVIEDDFLIAKKISDGTGITQPLFDNKYKILDIQNEAPEAIKYTFSPLGIVTNENDRLAGFGWTGSTPSDPDVSVFPDPDKRIDKEDIQDIEITKAGWLSTVSSVGEAATAAQGSDLIVDFGTTGSNKLYLSWENSGAHSQRYRVSSVRQVPINITDELEGTYQIKLSSKISSTDANIAAHGSETEHLHEALVFKIERRDEKPGEEFSGKFFVKTKDNPDLLTFEDPTLENQIFISTSQETYWLWSSEGDVDNDETSGLVNAIVPDAPSDSVGITPTSTPEDWDGLLEDYNNPAENKKAFFIDNLPFVASNPSSTYYAKEVGEGWYGAQTKYENYTWAKKIGPWKGVDYELFDGNFSNNILPIYWYEWLGSVLFGMSGGLFEDDAAAAGNFSSSSGFADEHPYGTGNWFNNRTYQMDYYTWDIPKTLGGRGLAPLVYLTSNNLGGNIVNGLEGIMTSNHAHTDGARRWLTSSGIHGEFETDNTYGRPGDPGRHFMHLSFLAPGEDLIDLGSATSVKDDLDVKCLIGKDSIASKLQGIWGGGVFTLTPESSTLPSAAAWWAPAFSDTASEDWGDHRDGINYIEFEGNYMGNGAGREYHPGPDGNSQGYDLDYINQHSNQWKPWYDQVVGVSPDILSFTQKILVGNTFRFKDDPNETVYTIKSVREKRLYNHTSWRMRWIYDGDDYKKASDVGYPLSVEEAASAWANSVTVDGNYQITGENADAAAGLISALENFGAAHNRRICYILELDKNPTEEGYNPGAAEYGVDSDSFTNIEFIAEYPTMDTETILSHPAIWETEPQQLADLNIYYEASNNIPTKLTNENAEIFAPIGCRVVLEDDSFLGLESWVQADDDGRLPGEAGLYDYNANRRVTSWNIVPVFWWDYQEYLYPHAKFELNHDFPTTGADGEDIDYEGVVVKFIRENGSYTTARLFAAQTFAEGVDEPTKWVIRADIDMSLDTGLSWYNCFSFGDGIESNRIRDTFNEMQITNGARASSTLEEPYAEEHRKHGLIYSGIYNSNSGVNNLNQFIQAEKITKDLNPTYGSIQKLFTRSTDLVAMCEDRVLKILANKDAVFNADGNPQLVATENVLGQAVPFVGDYGISKNPESFASESYRAYFTDKQRGSVLRLSMDGLTPISDAGMRDWFRDNLSGYSIALGSYDDYSKHYNLTLDNYPVDTSNLVTSSNVDQGAELVVYQNSVNHLLDSLPLIGIALSESPYAINEIWQISQDSSEEYIDLVGFDISSLVPLKNMSLNSSTTITHHPAIPKGHFVEAVQGQQGIVQEFGEFLQPPIIDTPYNSFIVPYYARLNLNAQDASVGALSIGNNIFVENYGSGAPIMYAARTYADFGSSAESSYDGPPDSPLVNSPVGSIWRLQNDNNDEPGGIAFSPQNYGSVFDIAQPAGRKYSVKMMSSFVDVGLGEAPGATGPIGQMPEEVTSAFENATIKTIFNGEEIVIYFTTGVFNITHPVQLSDGFNILVELFDGEEPVNPDIIVPLGTNVEIVDGETLQAYNANHAFNPLTDNPYEAHHVLFEEYTGYNMDDPYTAYNGDYHMGWQSNNEVLFPEIWNNVPGAFEADSDNPVHGAPTMNSAAWKFSDGTTQDGVLIENLVVKLSLVTQPSATSTKHSIYINEFKLVKPYSLINPTGIEGQDFIQEVNPIPHRDIPAWAEVKHGDGDGGIPNWSGALANNIGTDFVDFVWTNQVLYGKQNLGQSNTQWEEGAVGEQGPAHTYYSPQINQETDEYIAVNEPLEGGGAVTNFGDHIDLSDQPVTPDSGEQPDPFVSVHEVSGDNTGGVADSTTRVEVDASNAAIITQDISNNPLQNGNWYLLDISYKPVTDNIDENSDVSLVGCLSTGLIQQAGGLDQDSGDPSYPHGYFGEIKANGHLRLLSTVRTEYDTTAEQSNVIRCVFQYPYDFPLLEELSIGITKHDYAKAIDSIRLINITNFTTGGKAHGWTTPPSNYLGSVDAQIPLTTYSLFDQPEVYFKNGAVNWNTTQGIGHGKFIYQNIAQAVWNGVATPGGFELTFKIIPILNSEIQGSLRGYVTGNTEDVEVDGVTGIETNGFGFWNLTQPGDYVIQGNFNTIAAPNSTPNIYLDGELVYGSENDPNAPSNPLINTGDINGSNYDSTFTEDETSPVGNPKKAFFEPGENGFTGGITDIALRDISNYFTGGTVDSWNIHSTHEDYLTIFWEEDPTGGGYIRFDNHRSSLGNISQNIGHIPINQEVRLSFDCALEKGFIAGYYYNTDGKGFTFQTDTAANASFEQDFFIGVSTNDDPLKLINTVVITSGSNEAQYSLKGTLDNITLNKIFRLENSTTISFNEDVRGWESFKSFVPERGVSLSNQYFTVKNGELWQHYTNETRGSFYGEQYEASVTAVLNEIPSSIKSFNTINYEGSQAMVKAFAKVENSAITTLSTYNAFTNDRLGWEMESFETDLQKGFISEFIEKEGKWFNYIKGSRLSTENIDTANFNFQGLGIVSSTR